MRYFLMGPVIFPVHGQSLAFTRYVESLKTNSKIVIDTNLEGELGARKLFMSCILLLNILFKALLCNYNVVYFTCSRSILGSIKDVLLINLASLRRVKIVNHLHGSDFQDFLNRCPRWYRYIVKRSYKKVDTSIVLLERMRDQFRGFEGMNVEVVSNFYDVDLDKKVASKEEGVINLVYLSNVMCTKGIFELIEAFKILVDKYENLHLTVAGDFLADKCMSFQEVQSRFYSEIKTSSSITYRGKVFGAEKAELLQKSDVFVLPTYYESEAFPISIIEAMACGNAIITTDYKYLPDVISEANGILVKPKSISSIVDAIETVVGDTTLLRSLQFNNSQHAKDHYSLVQYLKRVGEIVG